MNRAHTVYFVKRPTGARTSYAIIRKTIHTDGRTEQPTVKNEQLAALNAQLKARTLPPSTIELEVEKLCASLNAEQVKLERGSYVASEENMKLLRKYWGTVYRGRDIIAVNSAWCRLRRAVEAIGP